MQPTLQNGWILCVSVFAISFAGWFFARRCARAPWNFYVGYSLTATFVIAFIPESTDAHYLRDIDARISFLVFNGLAFLALLFGVLLGTNGEKDEKTALST